MSLILVTHSVCALKVSNEETVHNHVIKFLIKLRRKVVQATRNCILQILTSWLFKLNSTPKAKILFKKKYSYYFTQEKASHQIEPQFIHARYMFL